MLVESIIKEMDRLRDLKGGNPTEEKVLSDVELLVRFASTSSPIPLRLNKAKTKIQKTDTDFKINMCIELQLSKMSLEDMTKSLIEATKKYLTDIGLCEGENYEIKTE